MQLLYAPESLKCASALKTDLIISSVNAGWSSCLLDHVQGTGSSDVHETRSTSDLTIVVATQGEHDVEVFSNGRWRHAIYQVGSVGITPGGQTTKLRWRNRSSDSPFRTAHLYIPEKILNEAAELYRRPGQKLSRDVASLFVIRDQVATSVVGSLLQALQTQTPDIYAESAVRWLATHLLLKHYKSEVALDSQREFVSDKRLAQAIEFMTANLSEPISLAQIAQQINISPFHFSRMFQKKMGLSPHKYLVSRRLEKAERLLSTTDLSIAVVAAECGYSLPSSFSSAFANQFGISPSNYTRNSNNRY